MAEKDRGINNFCQNHHFNCIEILIPDGSNVPLFFPYLWVGVFVIFST